MVVPAKKPEGGPTGFTDQDREYNARKNRTVLAKYDHLRNERASGNAQDWLGEAYDRRSKGQDKLSAAPLGPLGYTLASLQAPSLDDNASAPPEETPVSFSGAMVDAALSMDGDDQDEYDEEDVEGLDDFDHLDDLESLADLGEEIDSYDDDED